MNTKYADIPLWIIKRFPELSKSEIIVLSYLYAVRNEQRRLKRSEISKAVKIALPHVSTAVKRLKTRGWIIEQTANSFTLVADPT